MRDEPARPRNKVRKKHAKSHTDNIIYNIDYIYS